MMLLCSFLIKSSNETLEARANWTNNPILRVEGHGSSHCEAFCSDLHAKGDLRWKHHDGFLTDVLWGESVGLLPEDDRWFTIYFAHLPLARFGSENLRVIPCKATRGFYKVTAPAQCVPEVWTISDRTY